MSFLHVHALTENATLPRRSTPGAAGLDLSSAYDYIVPPKGKQLVLTDLQMSVPKGCYGRLAPRSGLALRNFIDIGAGVIDSDYRGNVGILVFNFGEQEFKIGKGDRIAQLICEKIQMPQVVEFVTYLEGTDRGQRGFGSTGI